MKKRKGFTLVELLVVIAIIALLMSILMPALAMVRKMAQRAVCASNLSGLHKAILAYAQENGDDYPRAGGRNSNWGRLMTKQGGNNANGWDSLTEAGSVTPPRGGAFREPTTATGNGKATIGASLYLLIRNADVGPKSYICKAEKDVQPFAIQRLPRSTKKSENSRITSGVGFRRLYWYSRQHQHVYGLTGCKILQLLISYAV